MNALVTMSAPSALAAHQPSISHQTRELALHGKHGPRQQQIISVHSPTNTTTTTINGNGSSNSSATGERVSLHKETGTTAAGATVFVGGSVPDVVVQACTTTRIPEVQLANDSREPAAVAVTAVSHNRRNHTLQKAAHVVKIKINPNSDSSASTKVISAVTLNLEDVPPNYEFNSNGVSSNSNNSVIVYANNKNNSNNNHVIDNNKLNDNKNKSYPVNGNSASGSVNSEPCVTISVKNNSFDYSGSESFSEELQNNAIIAQNERGKEAEMVQQRNIPETLNASRTSSSCFYYSSPLSTMMMSSGQCSPSETLDSGTCSDLDGTPPPLPKKKSPSTVIVGAVGTAASHNHLHQRHDRTGSMTSSGAEVDSDDNESSLSCDSLNSGEIPLNGNVKFRVSRNLELRTARQHRMEKEHSEENKTEDDNNTSENAENSGTIELKEKLLSNNKSPSISPPASGTSSLSKASSTPRIRSPEIPSTRRSSTSSSTSSPVINECTYEERRRESECNHSNAAAGATETSPNNGRCIKYVYEDDRYYKFHVNERDQLVKGNESGDKDVGVENDDECFAGYKILEKEAIRSAKGTVRGVKNRVRAGIATFLQKPSSKNYKVKDAGKVVVYTTTMGVVRETFCRCLLVKQILRTQMVKYEERDLYMSTELQTELRDRIDCTAIIVPQLFIDGQYIGDADTVERLNESGELRLMLKPYKTLDACRSCKVCGDYRLLPCPVCKGSKKSKYRNDFTAEFVALKCMNCDEVGLVRCQNC